MNGEEPACKDSATEECVLELHGGFFSHLFAYFTHNLCNYLIRVLPYMFKALIKLLVYF